MHSIAQTWMWAAFVLFVVIMLGVDLIAAGGRRALRMTIKQAIGWSLGWFALALLFAFCLWQWMTMQGHGALADTTVTDFLAGYLLEKSLSVDNIFVFLMIFNQFSVPLAYQRKVLLYGVLGAIVLRFVFIVGGVWIIEQFSWVLYVFGAFLVFTGLKMAFSAGAHHADRPHPVVTFARRLLPMTAEMRGARFSVVENGRRLFTPLLLVLILIELSDVVFALDSIPAVFSITTDPFVVFSSNIFAIMGLRALYFLLAGMAERFRYLKYGLAVVLIFVGAKMLVADWVHVPTAVSLLVIVVTVAASMAWSWLASETRQ